MVASKGISAAELIVALAIGAAGLAVSLPAAAHLREAGRAAAGARVFTSGFGAARFKSVATRRTAGLHFERAAGGWTWREVEDGNGNGLSTAEIRSGTDRPVSGPHRLERIVPGAFLGFPPGGPYPRIPPDRGVIDESDPVQFGRSDIVSFAPGGTSSSGTLYVTDGREALYAVVVYGPTVRLRVWRYLAREGRWTL